MVARYARYSRDKPGRINLDLFGERKARLSHDIPLQIRKLLHNCGDIGLTANQIVERHTLLPYYTALREPAAYDRLRGLMLGGHRIFREVKGSQTAVPWPSRLRFCPECDDANLNRFGYPIWQRRHQLVTSLICLEHGKILLDSEVDVTLSRERSYTAASVSRADAAAVAFPWGAMAMRHYRSITAFGYQMLYGRDRLGHGQLPDLRELAWRKGFTDGRRTAMDDLIEAFDRHYGAVLELWPRLQTGADRRRHWLRQLIPGSAYTTDPTCMALAHGFLDSMPDTSELRPIVKKYEAPVAKSASATGRTALQIANLDPVYAGKMHAAANMHRAKPPRIRLTKAVMIRSVHGLGSLLRDHPLPLTNRALDEEVEDHFDFVRRRLRWMFEDATGRGDRVGLTYLLGLRMTKDTDLVREEWHRYYDAGPTLPLGKPT